MTARVDPDRIAGPETWRVFDMLEGGGHRAWLVGGCVRDSLAGRPVSDIDIATDARPEVVVKLAEGAGLRAVPTGIDHGTVTVVAGDRAHEVTTLRRDVETDGRRAVVAFSKDISEDAVRRDFTMNALYATRDGDVVDPSGTGADDLAAGRVRFIGDADARVREDYLRILRFFRFHAGYGDPDGGLDSEALAAIAANLEGLDTLPGERTGHEMSRLLATPDPAPSVAAMVQTGVLARILPGASAAPLSPLIALEEAQDLAPDWLRRLAALGGDDPSERLRLSRAEARGLEQRVALIEASTPLSEIGYRHGIGIARDVALLRAALTGAPLPRDALALAEQGASARFPVTAADLMPALEGEALGARLRELENRWIRSGFIAGRDELLAD